MQLPAKFLETRKLQTLVENQTTYGFKDAVLHIFETHQQAHQIQVSFSHPALLSMIEGKKTVYLRDYERFPFLPGESLIIPCCESLIIDFPEASMSRPARCMSLEISDDKYAQVIGWMNANMPRKDGRKWEFPRGNFHFVNDCAFHQILQRFLFLLSEDHPNKDYFLDNMLQELVIRILQAYEQPGYRLEFIRLRDDSRMADTVRYIQRNLAETLDIPYLSKRAFMSVSHFHRVFRQEIGMSPLEYIRTERLRLALSLLQNPEVSIKEVFMRSGFESRSYFNRAFKKKYHMTPGVYRKYYVNQGFKNQ
ncbi:AraC family transcriptional regulator [Robiginitalea sediminis]|uniref:AraC family transcriptional regulator n=1 Tax=Robiginitalea sediminis TaxID=1982593 RepID=UPI000B4AB901|nr:AraC family transcriptional regulator [Robiginitalea sediminis]